MIKLRFVKSKGIESDAIVALEKTAMPFTPSHVEAVTSDGFYIGAHFIGGIQKRPSDYDAGKFEHELFLELETHEVDQTKKFYDFMNSHIGEPYDWKAILGFVIPHHEHLANHAICSAIVSLGLRSCNWFPFPLAAPAHLIDPRDLLLMISTRIKVF